MRVKKLSPRAKKLPHLLRVQAAVRMNEDIRATPQSIAKRYRISEADVLEFQKQVNTGTFEFKKQKGKWNPAWDRSDVIHHPVDAGVMVDVMNGSMKDESGLLGMFDPDFDHVNGVYHVRWTEDDIEALWVGLIEELAEILTNASKRSEIYEEAMEMVHSPFFKQVCRVFGFDLRLHYAYHV